MNVGHEEGQGADGQPSSAGQGGRPRMMLLTFRRQFDRPRATSEPMHIEMRRLALAKKREPAGSNQTAQ